MKKPTRKQIILIGIGIVIIAAIVYGFLPDAVPVETTTVKEDSLQVTVEEEGQTHVKQKYTISSPVAAVLRRVNLDEGDTIEAGDPVIRLEPPRSSILDARSRAEARARVEAAEASLEEAGIRVEQTVKERDRVTELAKGGSATQRQLEQAQAEATQAIAARNAARAELAAARAVANGAAGESSSNFSGGYIIKAPTSGSILAIHHKSAGYISAGEPLIEIGNTDSLEVRIEVLSEDAVRIEPSMRVILEQWGGDEPLEATVSRVERQGKVEVSALGVEEQRVQVIAELQSPKERWRTLGSGYRVLARFVIWEKDDVLQVPTSALFRTDKGWAVFIVNDGEAHQQRVKVGRQTGLSVQILEGLSEGETVIVHPGSKISNGVKVEAQ